jgi:hypothetical protein
MAGFAVIMSVRTSFLNWAAFFSGVEVIPVETYAHLVEKFLHPFGVDFHPARD